MGSLTAGFGMGPGDPPLHGSAHAGRSPARDAYPVFNPGATLGVAWHSSHPGAVAGPKGTAVRRLKRYASWVQNVVRQFGPYPPWAQEN